MRETLDDGAIISPPDEDRSIQRVSKGPRENQVPSAIRLPGQRQMLIPEGGPPAEIVIDERVLQQEVTHGKSVTATVTTYAGG